MLALKILFTLGSMFLLFLGASELSKCFLACQKESGMQILSFVGAWSVELWPFTLLCPFVHIVVGLQLADFLR